MSRHHVSRRILAPLALTTVTGLVGSPIAQAANSVVELGGIGYVYGDTTSMPQALNGVFAGPEYDKYFINTQAQYPNQGDEAGDKIAVQSALDLMNKLQADDPNGTRTGVGASNGAIVLTRMLAQMVANGQSVQGLNLVLLVNPASGTNGYEARFPSTMNAFMTGLLGGHTTQSVPGVHILSIQRQYDLISDAPVYWINILADVNAVMGFAFVHPQIYGMNLNDPRNFVTTSPDGGLTQVVLYTAQLPITMPLRAIVPGPIVDAIDRVLRPIIETAYIRPNLSDPNNPTNNPNNVIMGQFMPDPSQWLGIAQRFITGEMQAFNLIPTPPNFTGTVQVPGVITPATSTAATTVPTAAVVPTPQSSTPEVKASMAPQSLSLTVPAPTSPSTTAPTSSPQVTTPSTPSQTPQTSSTDTKVDDSKGTSSTAPVVSPTSSPTPLTATQPKTDTTPDTGSQIKSPAPKPDTSVKTTDSTPGTTAPSHGAQSPSASGHTDGHDTGSQASSHQSVSSSSEGGSSTGSHTPASHQSKDSGSSGSDAKGGENHSHS